MPNMSAEAPTDRPINVSGLSAPASDRAPDAAGAALVGSNSGKIIDEAGDVTEICVNGTDELSDEGPLRAANEASGVMATNPTCGGGGAAAWRSRPGRWLATVVPMAAVVLALVLVALPDSRMLQC